MRWPRVMLIPPMCFWSHCMDNISSVKHRLLTSYAGSTLTTVVHISARCPIIGFGQSESDRVRRLECLRQNRDHAVLAESPTRRIQALYYHPFERFPRQSHTRPAYCQSRKQQVRGVLVAVYIVRRRDKHACLSSLLTSCLTVGHQTTADTVMPPLTSMAYIRYICPPQQCCRNARRGVGERGRSRRRRSSRPCTCPNRQKSATSEATTVSRYPDPSGR
jgi:hypothetical protein